MQNIDNSLVTLDLLKKHIEELQRELELVNTNIEEYVRAKQTLQHLKKLAEEELLVTIGANTFIFCKKSNKKSAIVSIGSNIYTLNSYDATIAKLNERMEKLSALSTKVQQELTEASTQYAALSNKIEQYYKSQKK